MSVFREILAKHSRHLQGLKGYSTDTLGPPFLACGKSWARGLGGWRFGLRVSDFGKP